MKLRNQILTALIISGLLPLALAYGYAIWKSSVSTDELNLQSAEDRLEVTAETLSAYFDARLAEIDILSANPLVQSMDFSAMRPYFLQVLEKNKLHYEKFIIGNVDGTFYDTAGGNPKAGMLRTFDDDLAAAQAKKLIGQDYWQFTVGDNVLHQHKLIVSNPMISYATGDKQVVVSASIHNKRGAVVGLIGGALQWKNIQNLMYELSDQLQEKFAGIVDLSLISKDGIYWYNKDPEKVIHFATDAVGNYITGPNNEKLTVQTRLQDTQLQGLQGVVKNILDGERKRLTTKENNKIVHHIFSPVKRSGYILQLTVSDSVLHASSWGLVSVLILAFFISSIISIALTMLISRSMTSPLFKFTSAVDNIQKGDLQKIDIKSNTKEFEDMVGAFNQMIETVKSREQSLSVSEERFSLAMKGANDGLWDWDMMSNEMYCSPRWKQMLGYEDHELENRLSTLETLLHPEDLSEFRKAINNYVEGKTAYFEKEYRMRHKQGHYVNILSRGFLIRDAVSARPVRIVGTHIDITSRIKHEEELHELNFSLENRVRERTLELEILNDELIQARDVAESANRSKSLLLSSMSHEIRTPLNGIVGLTELALRTELNEQQYDYLKKLKSSADILRHVLNDILDFSRIESGKLDIVISSFNFHSLIESIVSIYHVKALEKNLEFIVTIDEAIPRNLMGDSVRLMQILSNLISNAIKFTKEGSVTLVVDKIKDSDYLQFSVADTGIGISVDHQKQIFDSFVQLDHSTTREVSGTGLGLNISRNLIKIMGGDISIESELCTGSRFSFKLSFPEDTKYLNSQYEAHISKPASFFHSKILAGKKVLLAEDVLVNQMIAREFFVQAGMRVETANNGEEAVAMASEHDYDLIIMDIQMPLMDGYDATMLIRRMDKYRDTPIVAMSANVLEEDKERCEHVGMNGHIAKPLDSNRVITQLESYFR